MKKIDWRTHFVELIIVIIGISIAFWLNNLATESREKKLEISFLLDLKSDFRKDSIRLINSLKHNERKITTLSSGLQLIQTDIRHEYADSLLAFISRIGNYNFFSPEDLTLTSLLQSGDIKVIRSQQLKKELLRLLKIYEEIDWSQKQLLQALDQNYFPLILNKADMVTQKTADPDFFYTLEVKNYCAFVINDTSQHQKLYERALKQVNKLLDMIEAY